jgi:ABC-type sugar transport system permease subunit
VNISTVAVPGIRKQSPARDTVRGPIVNKMARWRGSLGLAPIAFIALVLYSAFLIWPMIYGVIVSFTNMTPISDQMNFIGTYNYEQLFQDPVVVRSLVFTLIVTIAVTVISNVVGLAFALLLNRPTLAFRSMRTIVFLPLVLSGVVVGFVWRAILTPDGLLNTALMNLGVIHQPVSWIGDPTLGAISIIVVTSWGSIAFCAVVYSASLQSVPVELYEASRIDGAGAWHRFAHVTWPMIAAGTTVCVVLCLISCLKLFDVIWLVTQGGPADSTQSLASYFVKVGFTDDNFGYASAIATFLLVVVAMVSYAATAVLRRREEVL